MLSNELVEKYAEKLYQDGEVYFEYDNHTYEIFESFMEPEAYCVNVYDGNVKASLVSDKFEGEEIDGGMCTGSPEDAVNFMLPCGRTEK